MVIDNQSQIALPSTSKWIIGGFGGAKREWTMLIR
jgi:hypothetical protein